MSDNQGWRPVCYRWTPSDELESDAKRITVEEVQTVYGVPCATPEEAWEAAVTTGKANNTKHIGICPASHVKLSAETKKAMN